MSKTIEIQAYCSKCRKVTSQDATFSGRFLKDRTCRRCGARERSDRGTLLRAYADELLDRTLSKPYRLRQEWKKDRVKTLQSLPARILRRPIREAKYLAELFAERPRPKHTEPEQGEDVDE